MVWLLFITAYTVLFALSALFQKTLMKHEDSDARAQTVVDSLMRGFVALVVAVCQVLGILHKSSKSVIFSA
jgi:uncharacterized membrane protein